MYILNLICDGILKVFELGIANARIGMNRTGSDVNMYV